MESIDPQAATQLLQNQLGPWHKAVASPSDAQEQVLHRLLVDYAHTGYGTQHGASNIENIDDYRRAFPTQGYKEFKPIIDQVMAGDEGALLTESPVGWAITRGTTKGESKFIPMTPKDLQG